MAAPLSGCTPLKDYILNGLKVGPNYCRPPAPVAQDWIDAADVRVRKDDDDLSQWWTVFTDPVLDSLVCSAYQQNLTLRHGPGVSRFIFDEKMRLAKHVPLGDLIYLDRERCIQCARCTRFQEELVGDDAQHTRG